MTSPDQLWLAITTQMCFSQTAEETTLACVVNVLACRRRLQSSFSTIMLCDELTWIPDDRSKSGLGNLAVDDGSHRPAAGHNPDSAPHR